MAAVLTLGHDDAERLPRICVSLQFLVGMCALLVIVACRRARCAPAASGTWSW